jgi:transposase
MVLNGLGFSSRALYLTPEFFANKPVELLVGPGITAAMLNDDTLGRALDALYAVGITELFARVAAAGCRRFGIQHQFVHLDSSSFHLHGVYEETEPEREAVSITYGYSKDERPDLKQVVVNLMTSYGSAIPTWLEVLSGNSSDKESFVPSIEAYTAQLQAGDTPYFVADSALCSADNLQALPATKWASRVPQTIRQAQALVEQIAVEEMTPLAVYKDQGVSVERGFRFLKSLPLSLSKGPDVLCRHSLLQETRADHGPADGDGSLSAGLCAGRTTISAPPYKKRMRRFLTRWASQPNVQPCVGSSRRSSSTSPSRKPPCQSR